MKKYLAYVGAALALVVVLALPVTSLAATNSDTSSSGLGVTPRKNLEIAPGHSVKDQLSISNLSRQDELKVGIRVIDFTYSGDTGSPKFNLAKNAPQTPWSLKPFITLPDSADVAPGKTQTINYSIAIPKNQGAGTYYSAIFYSTGGPNGGNVNLSASSVTLVFVNVPGHVKENMVLQKFGAFQTKDQGNTGTYAFINLTEPQYLAFTLKNEGNVAESPAGMITLKNMWGSQIASLNANPNSSLAIIGQTRRFNVCIKDAQQDVDLSGENTTQKTCLDPGLSPGRYTASLDLYYGQNGNQTQEVKSTVTFWYIPWWLLAIIGIVIVIIIWIVFTIKRKIRNARTAKYRTKSRH